MRVIEAARSGAAPQGTGVAESALAEGQAGAEHRTTGARQEVGAERLAARAERREARADAGASGGRAVRVLWATGGFASFGLGALGAVLPIVPTTPFLLVAAFCFARSSERSRMWFRGTRLYRTVLAGYMSKRSMTARAKLALLVPVTAVLGASFALMGAVPAGRIVVVIVWAAHLAYFGFVVKTDRGPSTGVSAAGTPAAAPLSTIPAEEAETGARPAAGTASAAGARPMGCDAHAHRAERAPAVLRRAPLGADGEGV